MREKLFLGLLITIVLLAVNVTVGINDYLMLVLAVVIAYITQSVVIELQMGGRALIADHFNSASKLKIILQTPGILTKILSFIVALLFSISFLAFAKGVMIKHGFVAVIIISFAMTVVLYHLLAPVEKNAFQVSSAESEKESEPSDKHSIADRHLTANTAFYAGFAFKVVVIAILVNLAFALIFTGYDTAYFIATDVTLSNFDEHAVENAISYREHNTYSRALINAYLLMDSFKVALVNQLLEVFFGESDKFEHFYTFYFLTFMLNLIKLIPLSVGYVLLAKGMRIRSKNYRVNLVKLLGFIKAKLIEIRAKSIQRDNQEGLKSAKENDEVK